MEKKVEYVLTRDETFKNYNEINRKVVSITNNNNLIINEVMSRIKALDDRTRANINVTMFTAMVAILQSNSWSTKDFEKKIEYVRNNFLYRDEILTKTQREPTDEDILLDMYRYAMMILATKDKHKIVF